MTVQMGTRENDAIAAEQSAEMERLMGSTKGGAARISSSSNRSLPRTRWDRFRRTMLMKSSPYIGSFRHSPPSHSRSFRNLSRASLCTTFTSRSSGLSPSFAIKTSPYIGYIRHAPPTTSSPRIGRARCCHCNLSSPCKSGHLDHCDQCVDKGLQEAAIISGRLPGGRPLQPNAAEQHNEIGRVGPSPTFPPLTWNDRSRRQGLSFPSYSAQAATPSVATIHLLKRLATWLLGDSATSPDHLRRCGNGDDDSEFSEERQPGDEYNELYGQLSQGIIAILFPFFSSLLRRVLLIEDGGALNSSPPSSSSSSVNSSMQDIAIPGLTVPSQISTSDRSTVESDAEDGDSTAIARMGVSVSSLAEAYYAHQASKEFLDQTAGSPSTPSDEQGQHHPHQLDYVITQVDIARMARNASRHLDVESILTLPTITYNSKEHRKLAVDQKERVNESDKNDVTAWSWMMVPEDPQGLSGMVEPSNVPSQDSTDKQDKCVICLEYFEDGDRLRVLPCNHLFHTGCIDKWLSGSFSHQECFTSGCPTCKKELSSSEQERDEKESAKFDKERDSDGEEVDLAAEDGELVPIPQDGNIPSWSFEVLGDVLAGDRLEMAP